MGDDEFLAERFEEHRAHLRAVAYKMLGSLSEAEDAVQESWLRLSRTDTREVENLRAWLTTVVARVSLNVLRSRRTRREEPLDVRVPDPVVSRDDGTQPEHEALLADSVGLALLVVLDTLAPSERMSYELANAPTPIVPPAGSGRRSARSRRRAPRTCRAARTQAARPGSASRARPAGRGPPSRPAAPRARGRCRRRGRRSAPAGARHQETPRVAFGVSAACSARRARPPSSAIRQGSRSRRCPSRSAGSTPPGRHRRPHSPIRASDTPPL